MIHRLNETESRRVDLILNMEKADIDIEKAVPLGLILNELLTNSFKHAFNGKQSGLIEINFMLKANKYFMSFYDNGVGYKSDATVNSGSLGLKLINSLSYQINADVAVNNHEGTRVEFSFN